MSAPIETAALQRSFTNFEKDQALKILVDYSLATGRKWQAIRSEILTVTETQSTDYAPLLTRQDLESWAARKSTLGDTKFRIVFEFLTHPDTLARVEFAKANNLTTLGTVRRVGEVFEDFFDDHKMSGYVRRIPLSEQVDEEVIAERFNGFEGSFVGSRDHQEHCLVLTKFPSCHFFVCHFFSWPKSGLGDVMDWDIERFSGIATIGNQVRLHSKGTVIPTCRDMFVVPKVDHSSDRIDTINLILHTLIFNAIENVVFDNFETAQQRLKYIDPTAHSLTLHRTDDGQLHEFIDQFRWNVVL
ncbi:hypothetical protein [uncultured Cohaesibacter sp.]|uniref:hypothetical protein n=1 Tax=uncultured Cohaesibacter sp. TaxID=1002546 RepID=UPI00292D35A7|nr:hypothetical protein [uncultured Cohaesibacter sp.]